MVNVKMQPMRVRAWVQDHDLLTGETAEYLRRATAEERQASYGPEGGATGIIYALVAPSTVRRRAPRLWSLLGETRSR